VGKSQFSNIYIIINKKQKTNGKKLKWTGPDLYWPNHKGGLSPATWAGLMFQPTEKKVGWTQPSLVGWAAVPARRRRNP